MPRHASGSLRRCGRSPRPRRGSRCAPPRPTPRRPRSPPKPAPGAILIDDRAAFAEARQWLRRRRPALLDRLGIHGGTTPLFEAEGIAGAVEAALAPRVALAAGGVLTIETTAAATLIDVDSGTRAPKRGDAAAAAFALN